MSAIREEDLFAGGVLATALLGAGYALSLRYHVARPTEYIVRTGLGIPNIKISKKAFQWPFQRVSRFDVAPSTYKVPIGAMSEERIPVKLPAALTIGPDMRESENAGANEVPAALQRFANLLTDKTPDLVHRTICGVIEGEARILCAATPLDALFNDRKRFKEEITAKINEELEAFGLRVYNCNIEELADMEDSTYFGEQRKRALQTVANKARVDVAEAIKSGDTGSKQHERDTRVQVATFEKEAVLAENERDREIAQSKAQLRVAEASYGREAAIAEAEARAAAELRSNQLQREVEEMRKAQQAERLRADDYTRTQVEAERLVTEIQGAASAVRIEAAAEADAVRLRAQAEADAILLRGTAEAQALQLRMESEATGLARLVDSAGSMDDYNRYQALHSDLLPKLAHEQAAAVRDMKPIIWSTGAQGDESPLYRLVKDLPPLAQGLGQWAGVDPQELLKRKFTE